MPEAAEIRSMFSAITGRYNLLNRVLSLGRDSYWRRELARSLDDPSPSCGLDLCCGTGGVAAELAGGRQGELFLAGADFSLAMCRAARQKLSGRFGPVCADGLRLPFPDSTFDFVSVAFGVRNFEDLGRGLAEMARVIRPGGRAAILEFAPPDSLLLKVFYLPYLRIMLPLTGRLLAGSARAYGYLSASIRTFLTPEQMLSALEKAGFGNVSAKRLTLGVTWLYNARRA